MYLFQNPLISLYFYSIAAKWFVHYVVFQYFPFLLFIVLRKRKKAIDQKIHELKIFKQILLKIASFYFRITIIWRINWKMYFFKVKHKFFWLNLILGTSLCRTLYKHQYIAFCCSTTELFGRILCNGL